MNRSKMKRRRRDICSSPLPEESPKRTKVHAQRKFAQGSNVNSPVITPIKELENERPSMDVLPEPVELLPIKRPNTEDFLTFLCFRGTPILPPSLNFFNTASIVDTNGQVHKIKSESPKNGPIDASVISKCGNSSDKPFIAFGVRKRADPIVISRQMDRKRRHALAIQALRRKYQEQKMAKIRALTISKSSEKTTNRTLVKTNSLQKTETVTKKTNTIQKSQNIKVIATKHVQVTTRTLKTTLRPTNLKQKMCLRSFRGRFVQRELPFKKNKIILERSNRRVQNNKTAAQNGKDEEYETEEEEEEVVIDKTPKTSKKSGSKQIATKTTTRKTIVSSTPKKTGQNSSRMTRSGHILNNNFNARIQQIKKQILLNAPSTVAILKRRALRSTTMKKTVISKKHSRILKKKQEMRKDKLIKEVPIKKATPSPKKEAEPARKPVGSVRRSVVERRSEGKTGTRSLRSPQPVVSLRQERRMAFDKKREEVRKIVGRKEEVKKNDNKREEVRKKEEIKKNDGKKEDVRKSDGKKEEVRKNDGKKEELKKSEGKKEEVKKNDSKKEEVKKNDGKKEEVKKNDGKIEEVKKIDNKKEEVKKIDNKKEEVKKIDNKKEEVKKIDNKKEEVKKTDVKQEEVKKDDGKKEEVRKDDGKKEEVKKNDGKKEEVKKADNKKEDIMKNDGKKEEVKKVDEPKKIDSKKEDAVKIEDKRDVAKKVDGSDETKKEITAKKTPNFKKNPVKAVLMKDNTEENLEVSIKLEKEVAIKKEKEVTVMEVKKEPEPDVQKKLDKVKREIPKKKTDESPVHKASQRPSRKTKEAAAIYMEILSHKLVNDSRIDDDNVSIDSFPELPNVKKMEQRENELKAQAKNPKEEIVETVESTSPENKPKKVIKKGNIEEEAQSDMISKIVEDEAHAVLGESPKVTPVKKPSLGKRKSGVDSTEILTDTKLRKTEETVEKRQTRNSSQIRSPVSDDSDESYHAVVKIPRQKKLTRSKALKIPTESSKKDPISSQSDQSTTSDVDLKTLRNRQKNKKFTKTKSMMKTEEAYSDSDEEPLSKLTHKSMDDSQSSIISKPKPEVKPKEIKKPVKKIVEKPVVIEEPKIKLKRECAKLPQNYLPMFSSSSDDEFHGFSSKPQEVCDKELPKILEKTCAHLAPSSDLLSKDISRRFGKGKVNMSNEQIEKWLKESAMAGSSIKKENDEMLKFGERIPTETSLDTTESIDTQKLKTSLLPSEPSEVKSETKETSSNMTTPEKNVKSETPSKNPLDRKLIFKKDKKMHPPNISAFSPENESSVYAFGEETEPMRTPFRRPSRRPSSTATSRSEDESARIEEPVKPGPFRKPPLKQETRSKDDVESSHTESEDHFNIPQNPSKTNKSQSVAAKGKVCDKMYSKNSKSLERHLDFLDDGKYKVPSSPSASSSSSAKLYKRQASKPKSRSTEVCNPIHLPEFPKNCSPGILVEAPVFHPSEQEFQDPIEYIERIRHKAEQFGICRIVPPSSFKPECKVQDDMRFTAYNQYVHKMLHRWGPNFKELMAIKKYLATQNISLTQPPWIGGMEIDLPRLYQTVQTLGGLKEVIEKKKWTKVSEMMKIPKTTQDRLTKLDDIYCKYLLPYDTLSPAEREKLFDDVETEWAKRESKALMRAQAKIDDKPENESDGSESDDYEVEECIVKGRTIALNAFYRIARNTMSMHFKTAEPPAQEVEQEFWKHVTARQNHICVHSGSIDSGNWGYGFAVSKNSPFARHAWNLKVLTNNSGSVLRSMGPIMGVTVPTLHVGMVFSACCWYRDPHGLPWVEYLHTGGNKIWYGIPNSNSEKFHMAVKKLMPNYCRNKALWLISDTTMIPPSLLMENNVSLCRTVQEPGQFIVVFPKAFTSSISTGYVVSESVYFAPQNWLRTARGIFDELRSSCEPSMFSLDRLLLSIATDTRSNIEVLRQVIPYVKELCDKEKELRTKLLKHTIEREKMPLPEAPNARKKKKLQGEEGDYECETCRMNLFVSMIFDTDGNATYCLEHSLELLETKKIDPKKCKFMFTYDDDELDQMIGKIEASIEAKLQKKIASKYAGMPTLLK